LHNRKIAHFQGKIETALHILRGHPWGGRFQPLKIEGDQEAGGNGRNPSGQEGYIGSICEVFGSMLTVGS